VSHANEAIADTPMPPITLDSFNLQDAERLLCAKALEVSGSIVEAAKLLGVTRHALKRRIIKHRLVWPPRRDATSEE